MTARWDPPDAAPIRPHRLFVERLLIATAALALVLLLWRVRDLVMLVFGGLFMNGVALWGLLIALSQLPARRSRRAWHGGTRALGTVPGGS